MKKTFLILAVFLAACNYPVATLVPTETATETTTQTVAPTDAPTNTPTETPTPTAVPIATEAQMFVEPEQFLSEARVGTTDYVVTWQKLGLPAAEWSIREDVVFGPDHPNWVGVENYLGSRGYEFRYYLHDHPEGHLQEFHTTISVYEHDTPEFIGDTPIDLGHGVTGYIIQAHDGDNTIRIYFSFANYQINVKIKFSDYETAVPLLIQSGVIIVDEFHR